MVLLIDNYDSFVHNLARYVAELGIEPVVVRNDAISVGEVRRLVPQAVILSPGPGTPQESGICLELVRELTEIPMLGVCLGHQAIVHALGGAVVRAVEPVHGRTSWIEHEAEGLFADLPSPLLATRYHSLVAEPALLPDALVASAWTADGVIMAVRHRARPLFGVQFHPESVLTQGGHTLLGNFLRMAGLSLQSTVAPDYTAAPLSDDFYQRPIAGPG